MYLFWSDEDIVISPFVEAIFDDRGDPAPGSYYIAARVPSRHPLYPVSLLTFFVTSLTGCRSYRCRKTIQPITSSLHQPITPSTHHSINPSPHHLITSSPHHPITSSSHHLINPLPLR
jgi:hypothetical protein